MERRKLFLRIDQMLQGSFVPGELNLLFIFQLDCPGLYTYGIPQTNALYREFSRQGLNVVGLSTAFGNALFNTAQNTRLLLLNSLAPSSPGFPFDQSIDFPVGYDCLVSQATFEKEYLNEFWHYQQWSYFKENGPLRVDLQREILPFTRRIDPVPLTYLFNVFPGVPGWVLFDRRMNIVHRWFGHCPLPEIQLLIGHWLECQPHALPVFGAPQRSTTL